MPFTSPGAYACKSLQQKLVDYYGKNSPQYKTLGSKAFVKFLLSPQNTRSFRQITDELTPIPGKKRAIAFLVDQPYCFDVCNPVTTCTTSRTVLAPSSQEVVFDLTGPAFRVCDANGAPIKLTFAEDDLMKYCTIDNTDYITGHMSRYKDRFIEALDKALLTIVTSKVGTNGKGASITKLPLFIKTTAPTFTNVPAAAINPEALWTMDQVYADAANEGQYALVGGTVLSHVMAAKKYPGLHLGGIDLMNVGDAVPYTYYDRNANTVIGINDILQFAPGSTQLVQWNQFKGFSRRSVTDLYTNSTFIDPETGLEIDYTWFFDPRCRTWEFELSLYAELAVTQPGACGVPGVNGIIRFTDCTTGGDLASCADSDSDFDS